MSQNLVKFLFGYLWERVHTNSVLQILEYFLMSTGILFTTLTCRYVNVNCYILRISEHTYLKHVNASF